MSHISAVRAELWASLRRWRRAPQAPAAAGAVLAVGIGAATAVFGVVNVALLRPLPYPKPAELVFVTSHFPNMRLDMGLSAPEGLEFGRLTTAFTGVGLAYFDSVPVIGDREPLVATAAYASHSLLEVLAVPPVIGQGLTTTEDTPSSALTALLSFGFWRRAFGGDLGVIGRTVSIDGRPRQILGVMPPDFDLLNRRVDVWLPLRLDLGAPGNRSNHVYTVIARRRSGVSFDQARADVARAVSIWGDAVSEFHTPDPKSHPVQIAELADVIRGTTQQTVGLIAGAVLLVLLVAAANAASLMVSEADRRLGELAVRAALGASLRRLTAASLIEGLLLGLLATVVGAAEATAIGRALWAAAPAALVALTPVFDWRVWLFGGGVALGTGFLCGVAPFARLRPTSLARRLTVEGRLATASAGRQRVRRVMVGLEVALAVTLLSGSVLMIESLWKLNRIDPGFKPTGLVRGSITLPRDGYPDLARVNQFYDALVPRLQATVGTAGVAVMSGLPPDRRANNTSFFPEGATLEGHMGIPPVQYLQFISPDFFKTLEIPIREGRGFTASDRRDSQPVVIINEQAAKVYWPDGQVLGRRLRAMAAGLPWLTVVGVTANVRQGGLRQEPGTELFLPLPQAANAFGDLMTRSMNVVIRADGADPTVLVSPLRRAVAELDPSLTVATIEPMTDVITRSIAAPRFLAFVLSIFAGVATLLSIASVYGVVSQSVNQRRREFAIRRSLGAGSATISRLVLLQTQAVVGAGLAAGIVSTLGLSKWLLPFLFDVPPGSVSRLAGTVGLLALVALGACTMPLLRALQIDPARALRDD